MCIYFYEIKLAITVRAFSKENCVLSYSYFCTWLQFVPELSHREKDFTHIKGKVPARNAYNHLSSS